MSRNVRQITKTNGKMAIDMLGKCNEILEEAISEVTDDIDYSVSFAVLTNSSEYPNTNI